MCRRQTACVRNDVTLALNPFSSPPPYSRCLQDIASGEAKANPSRLFEGHDWVEWLPGPSRADCKRGVKLALDFLVGKGVLHPDPECRPQDVGSSRMILTEAVALYEEQRQREMELERDDEELKGAAREDSGAGG